MGVTGNRLRSAVVAHVALLLGAACFADGGTATHNGADTSSDASSGDGPTGSPAATAATTGDGSTSTPPVTSTTPDPTTTTDDPPGTTGGACLAAGAGCTTDADCCGCLACLAGQCTAQAAACAPCQVCGDQGVCEAGAEGAPCTPPGDTCSAKAWGEDGGTCYAYAPVVGECNAASECVADPTCTARGAAIISCPDCRRDGNPCLAGVAVAAINLLNYCHTSEPAPGCQSTCDDFGDGPTSVPYVCDDKGMCMSEPATACAPYYCDGAACSATCDNTGCQPNYFCSEGVCYPI